LDIEINNNNNNNNEDNVCKISLYISFIYVLIFID